MHSSLFWLPVAALPLAWLLPNHYPPWLSAWHEGLALCLLAVASLTYRHAGYVSWPWLVFVTVAAASATLQAAAGHIFFVGDAFMVLLYLGAFVLAIALGSSLDATQGPGQLTGLEVLCLGLLTGALVSTALAVYQWMGMQDLEIWVADLPPGGRPFANVAQPNHLCSIAFLGVVCASFLRQRRRLWKGAYWPLVGCLLAGMAMTSSRTGWLQIGMFVITILLINQRVRLVPGPRGALAIAALFASMSWVWPMVFELTQSSSTRQAAQMLESGTRPLHWASLVDAISQQPLWGYGWQQVSVAQVRIADRHPFVGEHIEHSHNIVLDLMVWAGVPVGGLLALLALVWFGSRLRNCWRTEAIWAWLAAAGLAIHALVEFPLEYAYFLLPFGFFIGAVDRMTFAPGALRVGVWPLRLVGALLAVALALVGAEYLEAETAHRTLRLEAARLGSPGIQTPAPELKLLTQQAAFLHFAQTEARPGMTANEVEWMRKVSERFAYPPAMFRYALAAGLNGQPQLAELTLKRLCLIHPTQRCIESIAAWQAAQNKFPVLRAVPAPTAAR